MRAIPGFAAAALAGLALLLPPSAMAETTWDVLQRFGWTGSWSASCNEPPSGKNPWVTVIHDADGTVRRKLDNGSNGPILMGVVDSA